MTFFLSIFFFIYQNDTIECFCNIYADSLYTSGNFKEAIINYKRNDSNNRSLFMLGCCYSYMNDFDSACKYFAKSVEKNPLFETPRQYFNAIKSAMASSVFDTLSRNNQWQKLKDTVIRRLNHFAQKQNKELKEILHNMKLKDQYMRHQGYDSVSACCSEQVSSYWYKVDSTNTKKLSDIIDKYGYPNREIVGFDGENNAWLIAQHADHDTAFQVKVLRLIYKNSKSGKVNPHHYPYLLDRILVNKGLKQIFGTQMDNDKNNDIMPYPLENEAIVDNLRRCFGLNSLEEYTGFMQKHD
ncbi:MAG: tetratricopeptide repeat protein [Bacteroidales bacterium]|nr:tetratricopeptide repeat protein [Bacteroidales bacterium]